MDSAESDKAARKRAHIVRTTGEVNIHDVITRLEILEERMSAYELVAPAEFRKLPTDTVAEILALDPAAEFEVLGKYKHGNLHMSPGQKIRADVYPRIMDHVRNGLMLGKVVQSEDILARYREEKDAHDAAAKAAKDRLRALTAVKVLEELQAKDSE